VAVSNQRLLLLQIPGRLGVCLLHALVGVLDAIGVGLQTLVAPARHGSVRYSASFPPIRPWVSTARGPLWSLIRTPSPSRPPPRWIPQTLLGGAVPSLKTNLSFASGCKGILTQKKGEFPDMLGFGKHSQIEKMRGAKDWCATSDLQERPRLSLFKETQNTSRPTTGSSISFANSKAMKPQKPTSSSILWPSLRRGLQA
jgi:hypothetical protein